jgi:hypothetical protein
MLLCHKLLYKWTVFEWMDYLCVKQSIIINSSFSNIPTFVEFFKLEYSRNDEPRNHRGQQFDRFLQGTKINAEQTDSVETLWLAVVVGRCEINKLIKTSSLIELLP